MKRVRTSDLIRTMLAVTSIAVISAFAPAGADARPAADSNHDRIPDRWEIRHHLSLRVQQTFRNQDHDELFNLYEVRSGSSPRLSDTDGDGVRDGLEDPDGDTLTNAQEQYLHLHPRKADTDGDGIDDGAGDSDEDGVSNHDEFVEGSDPLSICEGDEGLRWKLRMERRLGKHFRSVRRWFPVADYFDGKVDSDCDRSDDENEELDDEFDFEYDGGSDDDGGTDGVGEGL
jgi:hypothetical protein